MNSQTSKAIIRDLYRRHNITEKQAIEMIRSQFRKLLITMGEYSWDDENYPTIRLPKFGVFFVKPRKKQNYGKTD